MRRRLRTSGAIQATSLRPKLTTCAGCSSVRASIGASPWRSAKVSSEAISVARSRSISASARRAASTIAVSMTSWLVLPQCT